MKKVLFVFGILIIAGLQGYGSNILIEGEAPSDLGIITAEVADQYISLPRAKELGLEIPSVVLVNSKVYEEVSWEEK